MLSLGTELFLAFWMASNSVGLPSGSPPPVRAATSMFLISFANILPRRASMTAFLCLVVAHLECPLMPVPSPLQNATPCYRRCRGVPLVGGRVVRAPSQRGDTAPTQSEECHPAAASKPGTGASCANSTRPTRSRGDHPPVRRGSWADGPGRELLLARARIEVIKARALVEAGVPESTVYARCRPNGPWQLLLPGTVLLTSGKPTADQLVVASLLYAGPDAVVTGLEAARRHGVRRGPGSNGLVHVLVPHDQQPASARHVVIERTHRLPPPVIRTGVPLAPVARALVDGARRLSAPGDAAELFADAVQRGLCSIGQLWREVEEAQRRGTA